MHMRCVFLFSFTLVALMAGRLAAGPVGTWAQWAGSGEGVPVTPNGNGGWVLYISEDTNTMLLGFLNTMFAPPWSGGTYGLWQSPLAAPSFTQYSNAGLIVTNDNRLYTLRGAGSVWMDQRNTPLLAYGNPAGGLPPVPSTPKYWRYNSSWQQPTINGTGGSYCGQWPLFCGLADGSVLVNDGKTAPSGVGVFRSTDAGQTFSYWGDTTAARTTPTLESYQDGPSASGPYASGAPRYLSIDGACYFITRMPWGELFEGGECPYVHSLDDGRTWEIVNPFYPLPLRDNPGVVYPTDMSGSHTNGPGDLTGIGGRPIYANPNLYFSPAHTGAPHPTRNGGVILTYDAADCEILSVCGNNTVCTNGLPNSPGVIGVTGDTFLSSGELLAGIYSFDGYVWTATALQPVQGGAGVSDGYYVYEYQPTGVIQKYTPVTNNNPPHVRSAQPLALQLGNGNRLNLAGVIPVVDMGVPVTSGQPAYQWAARGPAPVVFDNPQSASPKANFCAPGNYVLNMQVTHPNTGLTSGGNVIVRVSPAAGGSAPLVTQQPLNAILQAGAQFTVAATGTSVKYQWRRDGYDIADDGIAYAGTRSPTLTVLAPSTLADEGSTYSCLVYSDYGCTNSFLAQLGVAPENNSSDQAIPPGSNTVNLTAIGNGTDPLLVTWYTPSNMVTQAVCTAVAGVYTSVVRNIFGVSTSMVTITSGGTNACAVTFASSPSNPAGYPNGTSGTINYAPGATIKITAPVRFRDAVFLSGYHPFTGWTTTGGSVANPVSPHTSLILPVTAQNITVTAHYGSATGVYTLNVVNGTGNAKHLGGETVRIAACDPPAGMIFDQWVGDAVVTTSQNLRNPQPTFVMPARTVKIVALYRQTGGTIVKFK